MAEGLAWLASLLPGERAAMGRRAAEVVAAWGPERFAEGTVEALELAHKALWAGRTTRDRARI
jgi:1,2-diacylglycerol 3-alpha-glucosyltransferase